MFEYLIGANGESSDVVGPSAFCRSYSDVQLMMAAETAEEGRTLLGALEIGVDGVVLCTDDLSEVHSTLPTPNNAIVLARPYRNCRASAQGRDPIWKNCS